MIDRLNAALEGRYRIERELGEGGMATVFLAQDLKHERMIALKVLKPELAAVIGADRFLAEIKTTANLQHPHILPLFDSGEAGGFLYYVMPYIDGETLADRLAREGQLGVEESVRIARDVADALDYAHRSDVLHRDIKPGNILLHDGRPVVADFGIALAISAAGGGRMTETGLSLGTPHYMSPEQASADRDLSARSDVYSLGCVLYEMLAGQPPHTGPSAQSILVRILTEDPRPVTDVRRTVPAHVAATVMKSIEKLPADRFDTARDFMDALEDPSFTYSPALRPAVTAPVAQAQRAAEPRSPVTRWLPWAAAAAAAIVAAWALIPEPAPAPPPTYRMTLSDFVVESTSGGGWRVAISRDGSAIVAGGADALLYVRRSDDTEFRPIPGTRGGRNPSISPDGQWVVFQQGGGLVKTQLAGGPVLPVVEPGGSPHWFSQDEILYGGPEGAYTVHAAGGAGTVIMEGDVSRPFMLPGGRGLLFGSRDGVVVADLESGDTTHIAPGGSTPRYVPTGHILFGDRTLQAVFAVPFDLESLTVTGDAAPVLPSVNVFGGGAVQLAVSDNGTLVHGLAVAEGRVAGEQRMTWFAADGTRTDLLQVFGRGQVDYPRISPDGARVAYADDDADEVFAYDLTTGERTQITRGLNASRPVWSPDGSHLYVVTSGPFRWMRVAAGGSTDPVTIMESVTGFIIDVSGDGAWGVVEEVVGSEGTPNLLVARLDSDSVTVQPYLRADWHEEEGVISPDGRWLAYVSSQGETHGIYIRSFPQPGPALQVSDQYGDGPVWAPDGSALYFVREGQLVRRAVRLGEAVTLGEEAELFSVAGTIGSTQGRMYDIHPDGDRFLFVTSDLPSGAASAPESPSYEGIGPVVVVVNWFEELRARMGESDR